MKIISKFKDYYDGGAQYGIDKDIVYIRETTSELINNINLKEFEIIGFCGKIYPIINYSLKFNFNSEWERNPKYYILFEEDTINYTFIEKQNKNITTYIKTFEKEKHHYSWHWKTKREFFNYLKNYKEFNDIFLNKKVPIFHIKNISRYDTEITYNQNLKDLAFYKLFDTNQAFQEISMYISNILVSDVQVKIPVGNDIVLRNSKGFDKWSFRRERK